MKILDIYIFIYKSELSYKSMKLQKAKLYFVYNLLISLLKKLLESKKLRLKDKCNYVKINRD